MLSSFGSMCLKTKPRAKMSCHIITLSAEEMITSGCIRRGNSLMAVTVSVRSSTLSILSPIADTLREHRNCRSFHSTASRICQRSPGFLVLGLWDHIVPAVNKQKNRTNHLFVSWKTTNTAPSAAEALQCFAYIKILYLSSYFYQQCWRDFSSVYWKCISKPSKINTRADATSTAEAKQTPTKKYFRYGMR